MDSNLLQIVCCPKNGQSLREAGAMELEALNLCVCPRISGGGHSGKTFRWPLGAALIREDGLVAYPVCNNIPLLVAEEAIAIGKTL
ncbi:MAG: hypothetical protein JMM76_00425 [Candidatus Xiphinematobacter sp.]|nr:MAG: hypothetical protein JMM76_00425 [Candidatus Xiphinematobacter sp.]QQY11413.1 MAG: hypothetical protein JMM77_00440 [Candidatus Xiphinematobacter sp.]